MLQKNKEIKNKIKKEDGKGENDILEALSQIRGCRLMYLMGEDD